MSSILKIFNYFQIDTRDYYKVDCYHIGHPQPHGDVILVDDIRQTLVVRDPNTYEFIVYYCP